MDARTLAAPIPEPAEDEERRGLAAVNSSSDDSPWTHFARLMAEAYRYAPLFA